MKCFIFSSFIFLVALGECLGRSRTHLQNVTNKRKIRLEDLEHILKSNKIEIPKRVQKMIETAAIEQHDIIKEKKPQVFQLLPTATDLVPENRLNYFREDIGLCNLHWHWHLLNPPTFTSATRGEIDTERKGERFYYFHEQIGARYNSERLCNNLSRVVPLDWNVPIEEAYFSKLDRLLGSRIWPSRPENQVLSDTKTFKVSSLPVWEEKIYEVINSGVFKTSNGTTIKLSEVNGIDTLVNIVTVASDYYGNLHSAGHHLIAHVHDPLDKYLEGPGISGYTGVDIRDHIAYRWHTYISKLFRDYKKTLPSYTDDELTNPGVTVESVKIVSSEGTNQLLTYWQNDIFNLTRGIDFFEPHPVLVNFTYLNHADFHYNIKVTSNATRQATCRIFITPKYNESGQPWPLAEQKVLLIELDTFAVNLTKGVNTITRLSSQSSVTIPFNQTYRDLQTNRPDDDDTEELRKFNFCGCGWPHNLLIPKGNETGVAFELFVMLSNIEQDILTNTTLPLVSETESGENLCKQAYAYCGLRDQTYPDARPMYYPFDRFPKEKTLKEFLRPNMKVADVTIYHKNVVVTV